MRDNIILYLEGKSGISGDMTVAALLDLGVDRDYFDKALQSLHLEGVRWEISRVDKNGIMACDFNVILDEAHEHHDHGHSRDQEHEHHDHGHRHENEHHGHTHQGLAHEHEHGHHDHDHHHAHEHGHHEHEHNHTHGHEHSHDHGHTHDHEHDHDHDYNHGEHEHRNLHAVGAIIDHGELTPRAKKIAKDIFAVVAEAEAKVHGKSIDEVHFHEVGALDSIIDIVGAAVCLDYLNIAKVAVSPLSEGSGFVTCQHGRLPVPVPATAEIAVKYRMPLSITACPYEMVTPTGIAIAAAIKTEAALPQNVVVNKIGYGAGKRDLNHANVLRAMLLENADKAATETVWVLESNIDDSTGEQLGLAMEELFRAGALDVHYLPAFMKKNRPGWLLRVVARVCDIERLEAIIYTITTTIGIRRQQLERTRLTREIINVTLPYGDAQVKKCFHGERVFFYPEHESIKALMAKTGLDYKTLADEIRCAARLQQD